MGIGFHTRSKTLRVLGLMLLLACGCGKTDRKPAPADAATQPGGAAQPVVPMPKDVPGLSGDGPENDKPGAAEVMVKGAYDRGEKETYRYDRDHPAGTIVGSCVFDPQPSGEAAGAPLPPPLQEPIGLDGPDAIVNPLPKEMDYYKVIGLKRNDWYALIGGGRGAYYQPINVVLRLRDVKVGRREHLGRAILMIRNGQFLPGDANNFGGNNVQFGPLHERAQFTTWDGFPAQVKVAHAQTGQVILDRPVRYRQQTASQGAILAASPELLTTELIRDPGRYDVTDARHPWTKGCLFIVDNPYVAVTGKRYDYRSTFQIDGVPPGKWLLEVWHPVFKPLQELVEVTVEQDKTREVLVKFHPPPHLLTPPPARLVITHISDG